MFASIIAILRTANHRAAPRIAFLLASMTTNQHFAAFLWTTFMLFIAVAVSAFSFAWMTAL